MEKIKKQFPPRKTVQRDVETVGQMVKRLNGQQPNYENYIDTDIAKIGKFHRQHLDLVDLQELNKHLKSLGEGIKTKKKEIEDQAAAEAAAILATKAVKEAAAQSSKNTNSD